MENCGISRDDALDLLKKHVSSQSLVRHCVATGAIMADLAESMGEPDPETWEAAGILHDIDMEITDDDHRRHGLVACELLQDMLPKRFLHAIRAHNGDLNGTARESGLDYLLSAAESVTGLISATALIYPDRNLEPVKASSVAKRMGKSGFARNVDRARITECSEAGWDLNDFISLALKAMKRIAHEIGL
jgi:putative nucleotidyltransferase with HDIG domain